MKGGRDVPVMLTLEELEKYLAQEVKVQLKNN